LVFHPNEEMQVGKRTSFLNKGDGFFDIWNTISKYEMQFRIIQDHVNLLGSSIKFYGEIYGNGIQKRVDYGDEKYISLFDMEMCINGEYVRHAPRVMRAFLHGLCLVNLYPPVLAITDTLEEALAYDPKFDSKIIHKVDNVSEGIVIKPYEKVVTGSFGSIFYLKKKNEIFSEKMKTKHKETKVYATELIAIKEKFKEYITDNRVLSVISKEGPLDDRKKIGNYISLLVEDAKIDFIKDHDHVAKYVDKDKKFIFNIGKLGYEVIQNHLEEI
jgi:Rnl2 family RNA ligase